jgi:hypothetical protein
MRWLETWVVVVVVAMALEEKQAQRQEEKWLGFLGETKQQQKIRRLLDPSPLLQQTV